MLGLIFLAYAEHRFEAVRPEVEAQATPRNPVTADDYLARSVLDVPDEARLSSLVDLPEGQDLGAAVDDAMKAIEATNPELRDVLPAVTSASSDLHPFYDLTEVAPGDAIVVTTAQGTFTYTATGEEAVTPTEVAVLDPTLAPSLTLTTCTPRYSAAQRLVVHAALTASILIAASAGGAGADASRHAGRKAAPKRPQAPSTAATAPALAGTTQRGAPILPPSCGEPLHSRSRPAAGPSCAPDVDDPGGHGRPGAERRPVGDGRCCAWPQWLSSPSSSCSSSSSVPSARCLAPTF